MRSAHYDLPDCLSILRANKPTDTLLYNQYVDNQIKDRELLMHVLEDLARTLSPVRKLELLPGETKTLFVLLTVDAETRPSLQGRLQKLSAKVSFYRKHFPTGLWGFYYCRFLPPMQ